MSTQVELTDPVELSVGGIWGHMTRRTIHLAMGGFPFLFFYLHDNAEAQKIVSAIVIFAIIAEAIRLKLGVAIFGQRHYESKQVSALAWGAFAIGITFLTLPNNPEFVFPLIISLSFGDPFLGELRRKNLDSKNVFVIGSIFVAIIWAISWHFLSTPLWLAPLMGLICVGSEWPRLRWIDDNATMILIPLAVILLIMPWL